MGSQSDGSYDEDSNAALGQAFDDAFDTDSEDATGNEAEDEGEEPAEQSDGEVDPALAGSDEEGEGDEDIRLGTEQREGLDPDSSSGSFTSDMDLDVYAEREMQREVNSRAAAPPPVQAIEPLPTVPEEDALPDSPRPTKRARVEDACSHPSWVFGMCCVCGVAKPEDGDAAASSLTIGSMQAHSPPPAALLIKHLHAKATVEVSQHEAERLQKATCGRLLGSQRLLLVLDLDHTLLNSAVFHEIGQADLALLQAWRSKEAAAGGRQQLYCLQDKGLWTKLRPGVFEFLEGLREFYELHIYTMGDKNYAAEVQRLMDPEGRLFSSIVAKDHSTNAHTKDLDVLMAAEHLALVVDDTEAVWPKHRGNVLQIERYHFFPSSVRVWHRGQQALLELGRDESSGSGALAACSAALRRIHARFYAHVPPPSPGRSATASLHPSLTHRDVRQAMSDERRSILSGCKLVFSRCWPTDQDPRAQPYWAMARALGAECGTGYVSGQTTHVVAMNRGTDKVQAAEADGVPVVLPAWLSACKTLWKQVDAQQFATPAGEPASISAAGQGQQQQRQQQQPVVLSEAEELTKVLAAAGGGSASGSGGGAS